jgi:hypothetical protein
LVCPRAQAVEAEAGSGEDAAIKAANAAVAAAMSAVSAAGADPHFQEHEATEEAEDGLV